LSLRHHVRGAVIIVVLVRMRVVGPTSLRSIGPMQFRRLHRGAIFTPPDVVSQLMLAVPLWLLYELGLLLARFSAFRKRTAAKERLPQVADKLKNLRVIPTSGRDEKSASQPATADSSLRSE